MTLTEFLLARIAEDEAAAKASLATGYQPPSWGADDKPELVPDFYEPPTDEDRARVARVLAECETKRRIVELHWPGWVDEPDPTGGCTECGDVKGECLTRRYLSLPYADHPDYRQEWKP